MKKCIRLSLDLLGAVVYIILVRKAPGDVYQRESMFSKILVMNHVVLGQEDQPFLSFDDKKAIYQSRHEHID